MGKCLSRRESQAKAGEDAAKEPVINEGSDSKLTNQKTSNGQIDANHANEATKKHATSDGTSTGDPKIESSSTEIETKSVKVVKTVRITEAKTSEAIAVEQHNSDQPKVQSTKPDDIDIDLHDPAVQDAATTIQAGFRGHRTRKQLASSRGEEQERANDVDIDLNDPEVNNAALKIQASFRGHLTRKHLQDK